MNSNILINFLIFAFINAFTPGPGNILALNTSTNYGIRRGMRLYLGIFAGYFTVQLICTSIVYFIGTVIPDALNVLKYIGAAYIAYLALHIALSKPEEDQNEGYASFFKGYLLQLVNIKIYMFGLTSLTGYIITVTTTFLGMYAYEMIIIGIGITATITWIVMGKVLQKFYFKHFRIINIILALTLVECIWSILVI